MIAYIAYPNAVLASDASIDAFGLSNLLNRRNVADGKIDAEISLVRIGTIPMYVADLYGDGLVHFKIPRRVAESYLDGQTSAKIKLDLKMVSDAISGISLGAMSTARLKRVENNVLILEADTGKFDEDLEAHELTDAEYFKQIWIQPIRKRMPKTRLNRINQAVRAKLE